MDTILRATIAGKARGWEQRKRALERYNMEPHHCQHCGNPIEVGQRRVADVINKKFCDSKCAADHQHKLRRS